MAWDQKRFSASRNFVLSLQDRPHSITDGLGDHERRFSPLLTRLGSGSFGSEAEIKACFAPAMSQGLSIKSSPISCCNMDLGPFRRNSLLTHGFGLHGIWLIESTVVEAVLRRQSGAAFPFAKREVDIFIPYPKCTNGKIWDTNSRGALGVRGASGRMHQDLE